MRVLLAIALLSFAFGGSRARPIFRSAIPTASSIRANAARWCGSTTINPASSCAPIGARPGTITIISLHRNPAAHRPLRKSVGAEPSVEAGAKAIAAPGPTTGHSSIRRCLLAGARKSGLARNSARRQPAEFPLRRPASVACARPSQSSHALNTRESIIMINRPRILALLAIAAAALLPAAAQAHWTTRAAASGRRSTVFITRHYHHRYADERYVAVELAPNVFAIPYRLRAFPYCAAPRRRSGASKAMSTARSAFASRRS